MADKEKGNPANAQTLGCYRILKNSARAVKEFGPRFNAEYLHSALENKTPNEFEAKRFRENQKNSLCDSLIIG